MHLLAVRLLLGFQYRPSAQLTHGVAALPSMSIFPATQAGHVTAPQPAKVPLKQDTHGVAGLESVSACPALQNAQVEAPLRVS